MISEACKRLTELDRPNGEGRGGAAVPRCARPPLPDAAVVGTAATGLVPGHAPGAPAARPR
jgi:hypothetical protein